MEVKQKTINKKVSCSGIGVHSGKKVNITIKPAPANHGIRFLRIDTENEGYIPAFFKMVVDTSLATVIGQNGIIVSTIEHLMATFSALEIDNALVEIDSYEMPILDGSAKVYLDMFEKVGIKELKENKIFFRMKEKIKIEEDDRYAEIHPHNSFKITSTIVYSHPLIKTQTVEFEINADSFKKEIASARTFGFFKDVALYKQCGLAQGATVDTGIALTDTGVVDDIPLRFKDEFARHKLLDCIGDMALLGMPILGHIVGYKSGHLLNHKLLNKILNNTSSWETTTEI